MLGLDNVWHWLILLAVVLVLFGTGKLRGAGRDIGSAIAEFRKELKGGSAETPAPAPASTRVPRQETRHDSD